MRTAPPSAHSDILESPWTPEERRDLALRIAYATGMNLKRTPARILIGWFLWLAALHGGMCGLSLYLTDSSMLAFAYAEDTQVGIFVTTLMAGVGYPLFFTLVLGLRSNRWVRGLAQREVILHLTMIPDFPSVLGRAFFLHWWYAVRRHILPFFLLGLGAALIAAYEISGLSSRFQAVFGSGFRWRRVAESLVPLWFVSSMMILVTSPLSRGAVGLKRVILNIVPSLLLASPAWIPMVTLIMESARISVFNDDRIQMVAIYIILTLLHLSFLICFLTYLRCYKREWSETCNKLSEKL